MDWPKARAILLAAFTVMNLVLGYVIWSPNGAFPGGVEASWHQQVDQVRATLSQHGLVLPASVPVPRTPEPMRFLHVEYRATPTFPFRVTEFSGAPYRYFRPPELRSLDELLNHLNPTVDEETQAVVYQPAAKGIAARPLRLTNRAHVQRTVENYLRDVGLMPTNAALSAMRPGKEAEHLVVEYVPLYDGFPVFSGYLTVEISPRGIETVRHFWVQPRGYTAAPPKAVRPAHEALLRLAGRLEPEPNRTRVITSIELGYYAGSSFTVNQPDVVNGWDTVPVWRIALDDGQVYYINAFNGEWES